MILLIEDRHDRQFRALNSAKFSLEGYDDVLENAIGESYETIYQKLKNDSFEPKSYRAIITHKSAYSDDDRVKILSKLQQHCKREKIPLVYFSGGLESRYHYDTELELIEINSRHFYSNHLKLFLEEVRKGNINPQILLYGKNYKLNIMLNTLEKINLTIAKAMEEKVFFEEFVSDVEYERVAKELPAHKLEGKYIMIEEIKKISQNLKNMIIQKQRYG